MLGGSDYYRAYRESEMARMAPDTLARSVRSTWDEPFLSLITPEKPAAVSLAGYDVFGPQSFHTTTRNMTLDLRGEAAYAPNLTGEVPVGASISSLAMGAAMNFSDCQMGCGCNKNPAGIQLPVSMGVGAVGDVPRAGNLQQRCVDSCKMTSPAGRLRNVCISQCSMDTKSSSDRLASAGSNQDLLQGCEMDCLSKNGGPVCSSVCKKNFGSLRGTKMSEAFFTPRSIQPVTAIRPYHQ
jgi:hypothetical protein